MRCLVTGASGQAGSYLCEHLLELGHEVFAMVRRNTSFVAEKSFLSNCLPNPKFRIAKGDVVDPYSLERLVHEIHPHWFFNAAAQSHVGESWNYPIATVDATAKGVLHCLEVIRKTCPSCKFLQFSSSELFGMVRETPQNELTPFYPRSPYGVSKLFGHWMTVNYRESYDLFCCSAILFNMESPRRGPDFVTQKIAQGVARIKHGKDKSPIILGNLDAKRDWNDCRYSMSQLPKILKRESPEDYVIGSGQTFSVRDFAEAAFAYAGIEMNITSDPKFKRPAEVPLLVADPTKARKDLGYDPFIMQSFRGIVHEMVQAALDSYEGQR
jgi:GDPmannose 4,6-dehydratase